MHESVTAFAIATLLLGLGAALVHRWHFPPLAAYLLVGLVLGEYLDTESLEPLPFLGLLLLVNVECDALLLDEESRTDTYPYIEVGEETAHVGHEATVSKINDEQIFPWSMRWSSTGSSSSRWRGPSDEDRALLSRRGPPPLPGPGGAHLADVLARIPLEALRHHLEAVIEEKVRL